VAFACFTDAPVRPRDLEKVSEPGSSPPDHHAHPPQNAGMLTPVPRPEITRGSCGIPDDVGTVCSLDPIAARDNSGGRSHTTFQRRRVTGSPGATDELSGVENLRRRRPVPTRRAGSGFVRQACPNRPSRRLYTSKVGRPRNGADSPPVDSFQVVITRAWRCQRGVLIGRHGSCRCASIDGAVAPGKGRPLSERRAPVWEWMGYLLCACRRTGTPRQGHAPIRGGWMRWRLRCGTPIQ
jgi:hypothetical protein